MKLKYTLLICFALAGYYTATAQTGSIENAECVARYEKLKELHLKKISSESFIRCHVLSDDFNKKINVKDINQLNAMYPDILGWLKDNIDKTLFKSYEEAEKEFMALSAVSEASRLEGKEFFEYLKECRQHCGNDILYRVNKDVFAEHPELLEIYK